MATIESVVSASLNNLRRVFYGPTGLRAGWRLVIFIAIFEACIGVENLILRAFPPITDVIARHLFFTVTSILNALFASWVMTRIEGRTIAQYGLPWRRMFGMRFWQGMALGFAGLSALLIAMRVAGVFNFGTIALHGSQILQRAGLFAFAFFLVGLKEEFVVRGYALFVLSEGIGFWPAAIFWSAFFGYSHLGNTGETWVGGMNAGLGGLLFCLLLRRTGDLWMSIGFHTAFDWAQTFFYGVPDSGIVLPGHLFNPSIAGPVWLSGGTVGPEGSWLCTAMVLVLALVVAKWMPEANYPNFSVRPGDSPQPLP